MMDMLSRKRVLLLLCILLVTRLLHASDELIWSIGKADGSPAEFALAPDGFRQFVARDFGYEDHYFLQGYSDISRDFPYVLPGPVDTWGGTWSTSGWRYNEVNILFGIEEMPEDGTFSFSLKLADYAKKFLPQIKISINEQDYTFQLEAPGYDVNRQPYPKKTEAFVDTLPITGNLTGATPITIDIPIRKNVLRMGGNQLKITTLEGSWILFDCLELKGTKLNLVKPAQAFIRKAEPAAYEISHEGKLFQPLLVDVEHIEGEPELSVLLDNKVIFCDKPEEGRYEFEVPMPAVAERVESNYSILLNGKKVQSGNVIRNKQELQSPAGYIDTRTGTSHSRWMIAPGPWMPFSMVKMSPDNQNAGWMAGYEPYIESIGTFSHIHEWTMGGLGIFASNGDLQTKIGDDLLPGKGYRSKIDKRTEEAPIGYYKVHLQDYDIQAELTATTRCGFTRFSFPANRDNNRILVDLQLPAEYSYQLKEVFIRKVSDCRIEGFSHQHSPRVWSHDAEQDYTLHFVLEFDRPIRKMGYWLNEEIVYSDEISAQDVSYAGAFIEFEQNVPAVVQVRSGISLVSIDNASENLKTEISDPFGWDFDAVRSNQLKVWNELLERIEITTSNRLEKSRFYNAMYRSICSRNTWSDVNGQWRGTDGKVQQLQDPDDVALGCDAFWNTFWNLNQFWNLVTPEWSKRWVTSQLAMYDAYGWLAKGPAGMNYVPVMVAEHEIPLITAAWQMGIRNFDAAKALEASVKMQTVPAQKVHNGFAGNRDLKAYLEHGYVPSDKGRFSNSMEYSYDDWCVGQLAKSLGKTDIYQTFNDRAYWWKNVLSEEGYAHMKNSKGEWEPGFDPFRSGANHHYVEGNAWQLTFFVPQDVPALVEAIGREKFTDRLEWGFTTSEPWRFNGMNDQYWNYPVIQGNQQSMHFAFLFNWAGKPWLTQQWSRSVIERYYGVGISNAYLGDEDQGQMSAWLVMASIGLFQTDGGCSENPVYEITSPLFEKIEINLGNQYGRGEKFTIIARGTGRKSKYIQGATLNGKKLNSFHFPASELLKGGTLELKMGKKPNKKWGR